jgi:peptidoglycan/LPS O-acetylase OafA/YrhL
MMYGVSLSVINSWYPRVWQFLLKRGWIFFLSLVFVQNINIVSSNPYYEGIFVFNMEAIMVFLIIPILSTIRSLKFNILNKFIVFNSKLSYSIYLTHASIILWWWLRDIDNSGYLSDYRFEFQRIIFFGLYFALTYVLSIFIYIFIEQPFLKLREKYTNS